MAGYVQDPLFQVLVRPLGFLQDFLDAFNLALNESITTWVVGRTCHMTETILLSELTVVSLEVVSII